MLPATHGDPALPTSWWDRGFRPVEQMWVSSPSPWTLFHSPIRLPSPPQGGPGRAWTRQTRQAAGGARPWPWPASARLRCATTFLRLCLHHAPGSNTQGRGTEGLDLCPVFVTSSSVSPSEQLDSIAAFLVGSMEGVNAKGQGADSPGAITVGTPASDGSEAPHPGPFRRL